MKMIISTSIKMMTIKVMKMKKREFQTTKKTKM